MRARYRLTIKIASAVSRLGIPRIKLSTKVGQNVSIFSLLHGLRYILIETHPGVHFVFLATETQSPQRKNLVFSASLWLRYRVWSKIPPLI